MTSLHGYTFVWFPLISFLCLCDGVVSQRFNGRRIAAPRQPVQCVAAQSCTYTADIALADCNGRQLTCLPLTFNQAVNMDMGQNSVRTLPRAMLTGYMRLRSLDFSNNVISNIEDNAFTALTTLKSLTLSFNQITRLGVGTFTGLIDLQMLHLQGNSIMSIHSKTFNALPGLIDLNLAGNRLVTLPDLVFSPLVNLRRLMMQENQLRTGTHLLTGLRSLVELDLDGNRFTALPDLTGMNMLGDLEITDSNIRRVSNNSFADCGRVKELILASNSIETIEINGFNGLRSLTDLHLSFNSLKTLPERVFSRLVFLERLYLQNNLLTSLTASQFATLTRLRTLSLANNQLSVFPHLPAGRSLVNLDLTSNSLQTFGEDVLLSSPSLGRLLLLNNPLQCDCRLRYLRQWFINSGRRHRSNQLPKCDSPSGLTGRRLTMVPASSLACTPPTVRARMSSVSGMEGNNITLDCSGTGGFPSPTISWRSPQNDKLLPDVLSGKYLVTDDGPLLILRARMTDRGLFTCVGSNPAGIATAPVDLMIHPSPREPTVPTKVTDTLFTDPTVTVRPLKPTTPWLVPEVPTTNLSTLFPDATSDQKTNNPATGRGIPRLPNAHQPPYFDEEDELYWSEKLCDVHPVRVAMSIMLTFILTCILCGIVFWSWYHRLVPRILHRNMSLSSIKGRRRLSRNVVPARGRSPRPYSRMRSEEIYMRPGSNSSSEESMSTTSSFEQGNRYIITESIVDPEIIIRRQTMLNKLSLKPCTISRASQHTYINADIVESDSNYTALCTSNKDVRPTSTDGQSASGTHNPDANRRTVRSVDSRIYMDLS